LKSRGYDFDLHFSSIFVHFFGLGDAEFGLGDTVNLWRDVSGLSPHPLNLTFFYLWVSVWSMGLRLV
jgi:hypothetical protein